MLPAGRTGRRRGKSSEGDAKHAVLPLAALHSPSKASARVTEGRPHAAPPGAAVQPTPRRLESWNPSAARLPERPARAYLLGSPPTHPPPPWLGMVGMAPLGAGLAAWPLDMPKFSEPRLRLPGLPAGRPR